MGIGGYPAQPDLLRTMQRPRLVTIVRRHEFVSDREWYRSDVIQDYHRTAGFDHYTLFNNTWPAEGRVLGIDVRRAWGRQSFAVRYKRLLKLFGTELVKLLNTAAAPHDDARPQLSLRQRQVLDGFCEGRTEQQIARQLRISTHTVHAHVRMLHERLQVSSRAELLAKAVAAPWADNPPPSELLPPRQQQVLTAVCRGESEKQIAIRLRLSPHTIHSHVMQLHRRLSASNRAELLSRAFARRFIQRRGC